MGIAKKREKSFMKGTGPYRKRELANLTTLIQDEPHSGARVEGVGIKFCHLATLSAGAESHHSGRVRSKSVGDEELNHSARTFSPDTPASAAPSAAIAVASAAPPTAYNERVVAFLRQPNVIDVLRERRPAMMANKSIR